MGSRFDLYFDLYFDFIYDLKRMKEKKLNW